MKAVNCLRKRNLHLILLVVWVLAVLSPAGLLGASQADSRATYDRYISAYKTYQDAVAQGLSESQIEKALSAYKEAKSAYELSLNQSNDAATPSDEIATQNIENFSSSEPEVAVSSIATATQSKTSLPAELTAMLQSLWSEQNRKSPDASILALEQYLKANPASPYAPKLKYELAKAYELLKNDVEKATGILKGLAADKANPAWAAEANARLQYYAAKKQLFQWKDTLNSKYAGLEGDYSKYRNTSWLAFPVKIAKFTSYFKEVFSFTNTQDDYQSFMMAYENMAARFQPQPDIVFDQFKTASGKSDDSAVVRLLYQNYEAWYARWKLITEAKSSIDIQYFIIDEDVFGFALQGALLRKAREGLKIRLMMDARGTKGFTRKLLGQDFIQELVTYPNVEVKVFNPVNENLVTFVLDPRKIMASDHDKILVVDGEYSVVGGRNIAKHYFVDPEDMPTSYRDCDVVIRSSITAEQLSLAFEEEFANPKQNNIVADLFGNIDVMSKELELAYEAMTAYMEGKGSIKVDNLDKRRTKALKKYLTELEQCKHMADFGEFDTFEGAHVAPVKIIDKHSLAGPRDDITDQVVSFIDGSRIEIVIQNPYVVLVDRINAALKRASARGVRIIFHTNSPASTDSLPTQAMFYSDWKRILQEMPTARIFTFAGERKLHAKTFVFDGKVGIVGTYNLDSLSAEVNSEVVAAINSRAFAMELRAGIMSDIAVSKEYKIEIDEKGKAKAVFGPDDLPGQRMGLMKLLSKFTFVKSMI